MNLWAGWLNKLLFANISTKSTLQDNMSMLCMQLVALPPSGQKDKCSFKNKKFHCGNFEIEKKK